jgi:hypothetical protein
MLGGGFSEGRRWSRLAIAATGVGKWMGLIGFVPNI